MRCALVSDRLDLRGFLGTDFARIADRIEFVDHRTDGANADIRLAVAWYPPDDAFAHYPNLRAVCSIGAGVDNITACPSLRADIDVVRIVDSAQAQMMSGFVLWHVIWHQRRFATYLAQQRDAVWQRIRQRNPREVPVAILGYGEIGQKVAADLAALGFPVMVWSRSPKSTPAAIRGFHGREGLAAMLGETEVLVNLLPLTQETQGILDGELFDRMRRGGYLIHVGRGEHLVDQDLLAALDSGQLAGAALDVFAAEPLPPTHPFWRHPNIVVTPHDASDVSVDSVAATLVATANAIRAGRRPPHAIDRARGY
ncbi:D-isomer specific 2-hydroxyacid dehydrogenase, NAD-binding [Rhodopseudomonas palustris HaA2]|uniref:D-isomer specific 2-hydroxyacid dehydrogenase, NAD-binding n=1 Tax=Rhodopseudomonas palustris (strain HaA2) TaxID=316058 RepID=Q2IZK5_RHOP2|nr:glyoxylate/hydroxypyruvate reductase A [Rhodopseudomonas palustris]ABD06355.1 D-isomer specific 2-hydroxyacid dehydrogenase, NAD-binding [Rhodopseudomonas palustris HaA2]